MATGAKLARVVVEVLIERERKDEARRPDEQRIPVGLGVAAIWVRGVLPAPGRLSITMLCPRRADTCWVTTRASTSTGEPGV
jgi:hypothetical protein